MAVPQIPEQGDEEPPEVSETTQERSLPESPLDLLIIV